MRQEKAADRIKTNAGKSKEQKAIESLVKTVEESAKESRIRRDEWNRSL